MQPEIGTDLVLKKQWCKDNKKAPFAESLKSENPKSYENQKTTGGKVNKKPADLQTAG